MLLGAHALPVTLEVEGTGLPKPLRSAKDPLDDVANVLGMSDGDSVGPGHVLPASTQVRQIFIVG